MWQPSVHTFQSANVTVTNTENNFVWKSSLSEDDYHRVQCYASDSHRTVCWFEASLIPVRTNNLKNFSKDFFFPTVVNHALKIENAVGKFFAVLGSLVFDGLTLPIRFITFIPRAIANALRGGHLFHRFLIKKDVDQKLLESGYVQIKLEWEDVIEHPTVTDQNGEKYTEYSSKKQSMEKMVNFIEVPVYKNSDLNVHH